MRRGIARATAHAPRSTNPTNPVPLYSDGTTFTKPVSREIARDVDASKLPFDVVAIDHLPSLVPRESSEEFAGALLPHLGMLAPTLTPVWQRAQNLFEEKLEAATGKKEAKKAKTGDAE